MLDSLVHDLARCSKRQQIGPVGHTDAEIVVELGGCGLDGSGC